MNANEERHPDLLPWHLAGTLDRRRSVEIEAHVARCERCRDELTRWKEIRDAVLQQEGRTHPTVADLVGYADRAEGIDEARRREIENHLVRCALCREDLEVARDLDEAGRPAGSARLPRLPLLGFAAVALAAGLAAIAILGRSSGSAAPVIEPVTQVFLEPGRREGDAEPVLHSGGPWVLAVVLPESTPGPPWRIVISRGSQADVLRLDGIRSPTEQGVLTVLVRSLPGPGTYELRLEAGSATVQRYAFRVVP